MDKTTGVFKDFNFKLAVIHELMYVMKALKPAFNVYDFAKGYKKRKINIEKEGYKAIREVKEYFKNMELPQDMLNEVKKINLDGGNAIYLQVCPYWDGEDDEFTIKSLDDIVLLPNIEEFNAYVNVNVNDCKAMLGLKKLKKVDAGYEYFCIKDKKTLDELKERGVKIEAL